MPKIGGMMDFGKLVTNMRPNDSPIIVEILSAMDLPQPFGKMDLQQV
jgi:hypothetical protein